MKFEIFNGTGHRVGTVECESSDWFPIHIYAANLSDSRCQVSGDDLVKAGYTCKEVKERYTIGFKDGCTCGTAQQYPDLIPIVDSQTFTNGLLVAFAVSKHDAKVLVDTLNKTK